MSGEVWGAWSVTAGRVFGYVFAANLTSSAPITPRDLARLGHSSSLVDPFDTSASESGMSNLDEQQWVAVNVREAVGIGAGSLGLQDVSMQLFSESSPLVLPACEMVHVIVDIFCRRIFLFEVLSDAICRIGSVRLTSIFGRYYRSSLMVWHTSEKSTNGSVQVQ